MTIVCCPRCSEILAAVTPDQQHLVVGTIKIAQKVTIECRICSAPYTWWPPFRRRKKQY